MHVSEQKQKSTKQKQNKRKNPQKPHINSEKFLQLVTDKRLVLIFK